MLYKDVVRPLLFLGDPERAHERAAHALSGYARSSLLRAAMAGCWRYEHPALRTTVAGISFPNPVGLAAGFDKDAALVQGVPCLGFGFLEVGAVTALAQPGNPRPRLFRLVKDEAIINRMGSNNLGADEIARRLAASRRGIPVGANIGKSKAVPIGKASADYLASFSRLAPVVDYVTVNVSSPNTPGLRSLQGRAQLRALLGALQKANARKVPIFVKIAPDLTRAQVEDVIAVALAARIAGIVATNTTLARDGLVSGVREEGGLSGRPLTQRSREHVRHIRKRTKGRLPIIGVGGVFTADDAYEMIRAGASLVQLYTGLIYEGPGIASRINEGLVRRLQADGYATVADAVGTKA